MEHLDLVSIDLPYKLQLVRAPRSTKIIGFQFEVNENGHNVDYSRIDYLIMMINKQNGLKNTEYDEWFLKKYKVEIFIENKDEHRVYIAKVTQRVRELSFESFDFGVQLTFNRGENSDFDLINHIPYNIIKYAIKLTQHIQKRYLIK